jgi:Cft2 family RNA processing exonuclease
MNLNYTHCFSVSDKFDDKIYNIDQTRSDSLDKQILITHAHSDHITNTPQKALTTNITKSLIDVVLPNNKLEFNCLNRKTIDLTDRLKLTCFNAGHVLGSKMFYFESPSKSLLYTGDFSTKNSLLLDGAQPIESDTLVIESTFGRENFVFPNIFETYSDFAEDILNDLKKNKLVIIGAYALGKSQEVIKFINNYIGVTPFVTQNISEINKIYFENNISLGKYKTLNGNLKESEIIVVPPNLLNKNVIKTISHQTKKQISTYIVTGWNFYKGSKCIPISNHADFKDILNFVEQVNPKQVFCMHGFHKDLAHLLRKKLKINAKSVDEFSKKKILDFIE